MLLEINDKNATNAIYGIVNLPTNNKYISPDHHTLHNEQVINGIFMSSGVMFLYFPSSLDATNFLTNVKNPDTSTTKQIVIANKIKSINIFILLYIVPYYFFFCFYNFH